MANTHYTHRKINFIDEPHGFVSGMMRSNLGYQMHATVEILETELLNAGNPHVLTLALEGDSGNPDRWTLYADGIMTSSGDGEFALRCFEKSATAFKDVLERDLSDCDLEDFTENDYRVIKAAQRIAGISLEGKAGRRYL